VIQKSTLNGSHRISVVGVIVGKEMGDNNVLVGITFVITTIGVTATSTLAQDARMKNKRRVIIGFINWSVIASL
jgi:hypothetical protein